MSIPGILCELGSWSARRRIISGGVAGLATAFLLVATGTLVVVDGSLSLPGPSWAYPVTLGGAGLIGLVVAGYFEAPIGADPSLCDLRWPLLGLISIYLATELREAIPRLDPGTRPVLAVAAIALLTWALLDRLGRERHAVAARDRTSTENDVSAGGAACTTCRPLFPRSAGRA